MALGVLNNISAIYAQNNLSNTQASLSKTLQQLSSGSRINSGADDAAGLSLANGLQASSTALTQSASNASEGVDFLQVADGALSQVTNLLNRAVTLATEASNGTLNSSQTSAADAEYQKILTEVNTINSTTEYNGIQDFAQNAVFTVGNANDKIDISNGTANTGQITFTLGSGSSAKTITVDGSGTAAPAAGEVSIGSNATLSTLASLVNANLGSNVASVIGGQLILTGGATASLGTGDNLSTTVAPPTTAGGTIAVGDANDKLTPTAALSVTLNGTTTALSTTAWGATGTGGTLADLAAAINDAAGSAVATVSGNNIVLGAGATITGGSLTESEKVQSSASNSSIAIFTSDGTISTSYNNSATDAVKADTSALGLANTSLTSTSAAQAALTAINSAITSVAADRGTIGANINTLTAVGNVMTTQSTNTLSAENDVTATDYGQATSDMSKYQILSQTGIAALSQANQSQQLITKLLQ